ncbi:MAG: ribonuclease J [Parcubacteria group bacterium]
MYKRYKSQTSDARQSATNKDSDKKKNLNKNTGVNSQKSSKKQGPFHKPQSKDYKTKVKSTQTFAKGKLRVMALGGLEEVGRNMTLIEYEKEIIIVDMGLMFPDEDMPGIDYIIPNTEYLQDKKDWIKGVVITHGHYDHIGAIPHIMPVIGNPPMFMGKMTAGLVRRRQKEYKNSSNLKIQEIDEHNKVTLGRNFKVEFLRVNHSIPDCFAIIVHTPVGTVVHTGDFKIDFSPVNDKPADLNRIAQIGDKGVTLLMSDSTDAISPGYQVSESVIGEEMGKLFEEIEGRIIIGTFASQLARVQKLFDLAAKYNKRIYLQGRSMISNVEVAHEIGYLKFNPKLLLTDEEFKRIPDNQLVILGTGAQGETNAFLSKVVNGDHRVVSLKAGDTVIFSSSAIPGNERSIQHLMDAIVRQGAKTINYKMLDIHAGGHAKQEDLKLMIRLMKPEYFMPIEAHHFMLQAHAELASKVGVDRNKIFVADNGQVVELKKEGDRVEGTLTKEKIPTEYVMVDGLGVGDVSNIVLRDRRMMAADGMIVVITTIDSKTGDIIGNPDLISRGFIYMKENRDLIESTRMKVKKMVKDKPSTTPTDDDFLKNKIRNDIGQFLFNKTKRRPMVLPVVIKV